jgi:riboflavin synthase
MFTGIITGIGVIQHTQPRDGGVELRISHEFSSLELGESVAVDGACLTVEAMQPGSFVVHVVRTSLERTIIGEYGSGRRVNLERALRMGDRLGGHLVQGHVDGTGDVLRVFQREDARLIDITVPREVARVSIPLGSITVDGVSLTVNAKPASDVIQISLVPFTLQHTTLGERKVGDRVHLEGDTIAKYVASLMEEKL